MQQSFPGKLLYGGDYTPEQWTEDGLIGKLIEEVCREAGVEPVLAASRGVETTKRVRADGRAVYFLLNHNEQPQQVTLPEGIFRSLLDDRVVQGAVEIEARDVMVLLSSK
ncbi:MAG: Beta-galactosidase C-terminal domain [Ktedonobacteraceae bacterium]|nr:Beta-galactosidase C-terminal domain [Ktedonobacteraceae bacterium]